MAEDRDVDSAAMKAATDASTTTYRSFAEATGAVLDLLERQLTAVTVYLAHVDRTHAIHRIVDTRGGAAFNLRPNQAMPLGDSLDAVMVDDRGPRLCNDLSAHPVYREVHVRRLWLACSYVGVPLELSDGSRIGSLVAVSRRLDRFSPEDETLLTMLSRVLSAELERETKQRDTSRLNDALRSRARGVEAVTSVANALATGDDARPVVCATAAQVAGANAVFLLEPSGREFVSTATWGVAMGPVTIQPRGETPGRAFQSTEPYFVAEAPGHPALAAALVDATNARSALFQPILREGTVSAVMIVIWQDPRSDVEPSVKESLRLIAVQAAAAINHAGLQQRIEQLALSDPLTGLLTRRVWDDELPREIARTRRSDVPLSVALLDIDNMRAFSMLRGEAEGDKLIKEAAALWDRQLREVDTLARLEGDQFGVILPNCSTSDAIDVLDRIRAVTPRDQTASAGVAAWDGSEPAELLMMRCMDALASAKAAGRDRTYLAD